MRPCSLVSEIEDGIMMSVVECAITKKWTPLYIFMLSIYTNNRLFREFMEKKIKSWKVIR